MTTAATFVGALVLGGVPLMHTPRCCAASTSATMDIKIAISVLVLMIMYSKPLNPKP